MTLWMEAPHDNSSPCQVWWPWTLWQQRYNGFILLRDFEKLDKVSHNPTNFGGYRLFGSGDTMSLVGQVISQDHVIKGSYDFMGESPSW